VLLSGISGGGKSLSAQAVAFELGKPLKVVNCSNLLSKWVGESSKNIEAVFTDATNNDAVLVFDEAEALFGTRAGSGDASRHDTMNVGLLLHHMETFNGVVMVITNMKQAIDEAFFRRFR
jgi:SpoVK/Ycf46/Vps4 family AAA+-type ATPase